MIVSTRIPNRRAKTQTSSASLFLFVTTFCFSVLYAFSNLKGLSRLLAISRTVLPARLAREEAVALDAAFVILCGLGSAGNVK